MEFPKKGIYRHFKGNRYELLDFARRKTTQKVNLYEKVQIPGYEDAIQETGRLTDTKVEIGEEVREELDRKQQYLQDIIADRPEITITYFVPDAKKSGGAYVTKSGNLKKIDGFERWMMLTDGTKIPLDDVADIESELFRDMF